MLHKQVAHEMMRRLTVKSGRSLEPELNLWRLWSPKFEGWMEALNQTANNWKISSRKRHSIGKCVIRRKETLDSAWNNVWGRSGDVCMQREQICGGGRKVAHNRRAATFGGRTRAPDPAAVRQAHAVQTASMWLQHAMHHKPVPNTIMRFRINQQVCGSFKSAYAAYAYECLWNSILICLISI